MRTEQIRQTFLHCNNVQLPWMMQLIIPLKHIRDSIGIDGITVGLPFGRTPGMERQRDLLSRQHADIGREPPV
ncbi:hypothetical protein D3C76_1350510 [compost metagenome]